MDNLPGSTQERTLQCTEGEDCPRSHVTTEKLHCCPRTALRRQRRRALRSAGPEGRLFPAQRAGGQAACSTASAPLNIHTLLRLRTPVTQGQDRQALPKRATRRAF